MSQNGKNASYTRSMPGPVMVTTSPHLREVVSELLHHPAVAVDTESNSLYAYQERVCLIQLSTAEADYIVDPLAEIDLAPLGELFASPAVQKVFHAAEQDVAGLKRDLGYSFAHLFDTMWAARILGWPRVGLADILKETFGIHTDKRYQRYNWSKRPLSAEALTYASLDTHYLLPLQALQQEALQQAGRLEEAAEAFARLAATPPAASPFGPEAFWHIKGLHDLKPQELAPLWALYTWRDQEAARRNVPPFKVIASSTLIALARQRPRTLERLREIPGMTPYLIQRYGAAILEALASSDSVSLPPRPDPTPRHDDAVLARYEALRAWRRQIAASRGVDADVVLSNAVLWELAEQNPVTLAELEEISGLGDWKRARYGPALLRVLRQR
jgi:ribonuclease D